MEHGAPFWGNLDDLELGSARDSGLWPIMLMPDPSHSDQLRHLYIDNRWL